MNPFTCLFKPTMMKVRKRMRRYNKDKGNVKHLFIQQLNNSIERNQPTNQPGSIFAILSAFAC
eukprot:m.129619 g.129619  ORF g.129619 m.129619 type:complete len:63 (-) comp9461_c1_seq6:8423-8611(-)